MSKYAVEDIIDKLMMATTMIENSRNKLLGMGFSNKETAELLQVYVYNRLNKED